jgi:hypothetical protein
VAHPPAARAPEARAPEARTPDAPAPSGPTERPRPDSETTEPSGRPGSGDGSPPAPEEIWPRVLGLAGPRLRAMLETMTVQQASAKLLRLGVPAARSAMARDHLADIVRLVQQTGARSVSIQFVDIKPEQAARPAAGADAAPAPPSPAPTREEAERDPLVQQAARVFGAKVTHIHPKRR